jgi:hypothetical protein
MSQETKKVLEMVAAGQITADDAEKLLGKLGSGAAVAAETVPEAEGKAQNQRVSGWRIPARDEPAVPNAKLRFLRVMVDSPGRDQVNVRIPLAFLRAGMKLLGVIPPQVSAKLAERGVDLAALQELKGGELVEELRELHVDVDAQNGEKVRVFCE